MCKISFIQLHQFSYLILLTEDEEGSANATWLLVLLVFMQSSIFIVDKNHKRQKFIDNSPSTTLLIKVQKNKV